ncbi:MAG TPA: glycosyltransferase family 1 protein [Candidatus Saccharimonadales bacterium]|nr:glycosyltransferase family 1 protein [Candidatus Saccharimonadales bacterium]
MPKHIVIDARNRRASTGRYTDRLVENLQEIDDTNLYTVLVEPGDEWQMKNPNFTTASCPFQQFSFNPWGQISFARQLYGLKPDLVHFTMTQQPLFFFGKTVTTTHDLTMLWHTRPSRFPGWLHAVGLVLYRFMLWWAHKKSGRIIVPSKFVAKELGQYQRFTRKKSVVIYEAADFPVSDKSERVKGVKKPFIFHIGAPYPHKNIDKLIQVFDSLKKKHPDLQLVLPGKMKNQFKRDFDGWIKASPVKDSILAPGYIRDSQLNWLYQNAAAYVLPSVSEGFGLPGLEAMAHGCAVASSNATCLPEIYGNAAEYFDPFDIASMYQAIDKVISGKKLRKELIEKGKKQAGKYSWQKMAEQTLDVYKEVVV